MKSEEKQIKAFRKFLVMFFALNYKRKSSIIKRVAKRDQRLADFLINCSKLTLEEQQQLLDYYDNPEVNSWL